MPLLQATGLACGHERSVLNDVELSLQPGEAVALIGPNGSGKSTLLKTLAGTLAPLKGKIELAGEDLARMRPREAALQIASVPQEEAAPFSFTVRQLVLMGRLARSAGLLDTAQDLTVADEAMRRCDCLHLAERYANELSGGERQRALIARALAAETPILLMDEPTSHLDAPHQAWIVKLVRELSAEGKGVIVALHDLNLVAAMADRAVLVADGAVNLDGTTQEVLASRMLDKAFSVEFERALTSSGRMVVVPRIG